MTIVRDVLRSVWEAPRPDAVPPPNVRDVLLIVGLAALAVLEMVLRPDLPDRVLSGSVLIALLPVLVVRRTRPLLAVVIAFTVSLVAQIVAGGQSFENFSLAAFLLLPYALARWGSGREVVLGGAVITASGLTGLVVDRAPLGDVIGGTTVVLALMAIGLTLRTRVAARRRELDSVRLRERADLARDLHDVVAHHVSAIVIRAQAGQVASATRPEAATEALELIEAEAGRALSEMRTMVGVLRADAPATVDPAPRDPVPLLADLEDLADHTAYPPVVVTLSGPATRLGPAVAAGVHRIAREAMTNARRHAREAHRIDLAVTVREDDVLLRVVDDGALGRVGRPGEGYGIVGMRERAAALGGSCEAGPAPGGGWVVEAVLPTEREPQ